jgi:hypothetical protein
MSQQRSWLEIEWQSGSPVQVGDSRLTPVARIVRARAPFGALGFVWVKPAHVIVRRPGRPEQWVVVRDVTRLAVAGALALALVGGLAAWQWARRARR